ncbi:MAG TPA: protein kinase [Kofleriaceae bacterium]|nr:protein kinase [Kofleriaceae bacterium]
MTPERFRQIEEVFDAAADAPAEERGAVLARLCQDDPALRAEVEALLAAAPDAASRIQHAIGRGAGAVARDVTSPRRGTEGERHVVEGALLRHGAMIDGRFTIDRLAETGGMGEVYRAIDGHSGAPVAIKVLRRDRTTEDRRFAREAQLLAGVAHPHIVRHVAHGTLASGERYLAMEWLEGEGLDDRLRRQRLTLRESVRLGLDLAEALGALHQRGIVHRDVKPSNVLLVGGVLSELRLLDLGIAWSRDFPSLTQTGMFIGSLRYAAPEQVIGARSFDARTDVFSLGLVLFECLAGTPAFESDQPLAVLTRMALGELPRLRHRARGVPEPLVELVDRMIAREPGLRLFDGNEVARALRALGDVPEVPIVPATPDLERAAVPPTNAITTDEQSAVAILLLGPPAGGASGASDDALVREAARHGGQLSWLGDGAATVLVAGPMVATDLAARAARCALALRGASGARPITLAIGPRVAAERSGLGPTIDRAARLLDEDGRVARPGAVTLDAATVGLLDGRFEVRRDAGGDFVLVGERTVADVRTLLGRPTPCVGRDRELRLLEELFDDCVRDGQSQAVLVTAPPGVGKTRLGAELLQRLRGRDAAQWTARASLMGAGSTLGMIVQLVQAACGIAGSEPLAAQRCQLRDAVTARFPTPDQQRLTEFLGEILAVRAPDEEASPRLRAARQDSSVMGDQVRAAFVDLLAAETRVRPVVLLLEDLHWADSATVRLIGAALRELAARPLYVIALARPEAQELFPERWTGRLQQLVLAPLSRRASEQLVRHVLGGEVSDEALAQVIRLADGNAFYLEELIRATAEGRGPTELPGSAVAMVQSRLAGLDEPLRRTLRAASVFGEIFWTGGVATLTGDGTRPGETDALLQRLVELELVTPRSGSRFVGETELALRHVLLREAAYGMLTPADRALGHQLAGEWLERRGERDPLVLAEHYDRGGQEARAAVYYLGAATSALRAGDSDLALRRARQGLAAGAVDETRVELFGVVLEGKLWKLDRDPDDAGIADEVLACARPGSVAWEQAAFTKVIELVMRGRIPEAISMLHRVVATPPAPLAITPMALCISAGVWSLQLCGLTRECDAITQRGFEIMNGLPEAERFPFLWLQSCVACRAVYRDSDPWRGLELIEHRRNAAHDLGFGRLAGLCAVWVEFSYACLGAVKEAREASQRATISDEQLATVSSIRPLGRAWLAFQRADLEDAYRQAERLLDLGRRRGLALDEARGHWILAEVSRRSGDFAAAEAAAEAALALAVPMDRPAILATLAGARLAQGRTAKALASAEEAMTRYRELGFCSHFLGTALLRVVYTECLLAAEQHERARGAAADARAWLLGIADKIDDARYRATFLEAVPEHRRILELAEG